MSPPRNAKGLTLSRLAVMGHLVRVRCSYCRTRPRYYHPDDILVLLGDREVDRLRRRLPCEECGRKDYVDVDAPLLTADEQRRIVLRRLVRIRIIRRPVWRDERL